MDDREWRRYPHIVHHSGQWYVERIDNDPEYALGRFGHTVCYGWADANGKLWDVTRTVALSDTYVGMVEREYIKYANRNAGRSDGGAAVLRRARLQAHPGPGWVVRNFEGWRVPPRREGENPNVD